MDLRFFALVLRRCGKWNTRFIALLCILQLAYAEFRTSKKNNSPKTNIRNIMCCSRFLKKAQRYSFRLKLTLTKEAITELLHELSAQEDEPWIHNQHQRTAHFKTILKNGNEQEILSMLHMMQKHRKLPIVEERMRQTAKKLVEQEFSYVLGMKPETVPAWIRAQLQQG